MLILQSTTDALEVFLNAAHTTNPLRVVAFWRDTEAGSTFVPGRTVINTNGVTPVNASGSPASNTQRIVDYLSVFNSDTANKTVTVRLNDNGTTYELFEVVLGAKEKLEYVDGRGFSVFNSAGAVKNVQVGTNNVISTGRSMVVLSGDITNNNAVANTIADVTGLSFPVTAGLRYYFRFVIQYTAALATTGSRWGINGPASPTELRYQSRYSLTLTTETNNQGVSAYDFPAASNVSSASVVGNMADIEGFIVPSASGNVIARFASEIASSAIVAKAGSFVEYQQL
jgi:hypothetical protein